mgnify:CR=1 FL=1
MEFLKRLERSVSPEELFGEHLYLANYYPKYIRLIGSFSKSGVFDRVLERRLERSLNASNYINISLAKVISLQELPKKVSSSRSRISRGFVRGQILSAYFEIDRKKFPKSHEAISLLGFGLLSLKGNVPSFMQEEGLEIRVNENFEMLSAQWLPYLYEASAISINSVSEEVDQKVLDIGVSFLKEANDLEEGRKEIVDRIQEKSKKMSEDRQLQALEEISSALENKKVKPLPIE